MLLAVLVDAAIAESPSASRARAASRSGERVRETRMDSQKQRGDPPVIDPSSALPSLGRFHFGLIVRNEGCGDQETRGTSGGGGTPTPSPDDCPCDPQFDACCGEDCHDFDPCTTDTCLALGGWRHWCVHTPLTMPLECDGHYCTEGDWCVSGVCVPGPPPDCDDNNPCTEDECGPAYGKPYFGAEMCLHQPWGVGACDDGDACTLNDYCSGGSCQGGEPVDCDDGNVCTMDECEDDACHFTPIPGPCGAAEDDPCMAFACMNGACQSIIDTGTCSDNDPCTVNDICSGGVCIGTPLICNAGGACSGTGVCVPGIGCVYGDSACNDGNPCNLDLCNPIDGSCSYEYPGASWFDTCSSQNCSISIGVPVQIPVNNDDDNNNGIPDREESGPVIGENDLVWFPGMLRVAYHSRQC